MDRRLPNRNLWILAASLFVAPWSLASAEPAFTFSPELHGPATNPETEPSPRVSVVVAQAPAAPAPMKAKGRFTSLGAGDALGHAVKKADQRLASGEIPAKQVTAKNN